jgi:peptidoglycan/LPS O-acetylase OafA/YrhL
MHRIRVIDAFRGIAILAVMAYHYTVRWPVLYGYDYTYSPVFHVGKYGVHVFFVVSGLVITMTVLRSDGPLHFAVRRIARLYPAMVAACLLTFSAMRMWGPPIFQRSVGDLLASLSMDAKGLHFAYVDGAYWSLAVEVKFYAFIAVCRYLLGDRFWIGALVLAVLGSLPFGQVWAYVTIGEWWPYFLLGMAGWYWIFEKQDKAAAWLFAGSIVIYALQRPGGLSSDVFIWSLSLTMLGLLRIAPTHESAPVRWLASLGAISYSLYLIHQYVGVTVIGYATAAGVPDLLAMGLAATVSVSLAALGYTYVEKPGARWVMTMYDGATKARRRAPQTQ